MAVKFIKTRNVKDPVRGTDQAAGIDFFVPVFDEKFVNDLITKNPIYADMLSKNVLLDTKHVLIRPDMRLTIPSGIHTYFDPIDSALIATNKSGVSTKKGLVFTCQLVDSDYTGEIHIGVVNVSNKVVQIDEGEKLMQFVHTPVILDELVPVDTDTFNKLHAESKRGENWQGSTDKNRNNG